MSSYGANGTLLAFSWGGSLAISLVTEPISKSHDGYSYNYRDIAK